MISRRLFLGGAVAGVGLGYAGITATGSEASIRFIGRRETIVALLDTGTERVLFVLGERDDELLENVPGLTTLGKTRIDMVIASYRVLATRAAREHLQVGSTPVLSIQADHSLPPIRGNISLISTMVELELGAATQMQLTPATSPPDNPGFVAHIHCRGTSIALTSGGTAARLDPGSNIDLLALPGRPDLKSLNLLHPTLLVSNAPVDSETDIHQMQVYPADPQVVKIGQGSISVRDDQLSS